MSFETRTQLSPNESRQLLSDLGKWEENDLQDLRIAVLGFGKMGILHGAIMNLLKPNSVKAVVDKSRLVHFGASRIVKGIKFYTDLDKMLVKEKPDVVYVTTPTASHHFLLSKLIKEGVKYMFVEKPPVVNSDELSDISTIKGKDQIIMVGLQKRYALPFRHARTLLSDGIVGEVQAIHGWIKSGDITTLTTRFNAFRRGVLLDLGIHLIDLLTWLFDVDAVMRSSYKSVHTQVDDCFKAKLSTEKGVEIDVDVTWSDPAYRIPETCIEVRGTSGMLTVSEDRLMMKESAGDRPKINMYKPNYYRGIPPVNLADPEYVLENMHFLSSVRQRTSPLTDIEGVSRTMNLIDEMYRKAAISSG